MLANGGCLIAGASGLNAVVVATTGQVITGTIDASGCDLGVYVGIIVHSHAPFDVVTRTQVVGNTVSGNQPYGIIVAAGPPIPDVPNSQPILDGTTVVFNRISNEHMGIGHSGDVHTVIAANTMSSVTIPVGVGY